MDAHIAGRSKQIPAMMRRALVDARHRLGWSQAELGRRAGLPQAHISGIESGKTVPRFDTLLDLVRVLDHDLLLVPRELVPIVESLTRKQPADERPLYEPDEQDDEE